MDVFLRFLRQLGTVVAVIIGLLVTGVIGVAVWALWAIYWYHDSIPDDRTYALKEALSIYTELLPSKECRWWTLEDCRAFALPPEVLHDKEKLGLAMDAVLYPCHYIVDQQKKKFFRSDVEKDCAKSDALWHTPIILRFDDENRTIKIRID